MADITGPLVSRRKVVRVGLETTRGTAVTPTVELLAYDPVIQATAPFGERKPVGASGGHIPGVLGERVGTFTCRAELRGDGAASGGDLDAGLAALLQCCGMALSAGVYAPETIAANQKCCTIYVYQDGVLKALSGCAGTWSLEGEFGKPANITFEMQGVWVDPTDVAMPSTSHNATIPPRVADCTLTIGSKEPRISRFGINFGGQVVAREDIQTAAGVLHYLVGERDPRVTLDPEAELVADYDWFGLWQAGTTAALTLVIGATAGNIITIAAPVLQYAEISEGDRDAKQIHEINAVCCTSDAAGDDDLTLTPS